LGQASANKTGVTREDFFPLLPVHSPKIPKQTHKKYKQKESVFSNCYLRDLRSKISQKKKAGGLKCYLSTPLLRVSLLAGASLTL
jgi:hypothetical protein